MTSTSAPAFTGFVPETITGGSAAGQRVADRYKSRLEMKRTSGNADQGIGRGNAAYQRVSTPADPGGPGHTRCWFVPDLYPTKITVTVLVAVLSVQRDDRQGGAR